MSVQGVRRVAAVMGGAVALLIVVGGALGPARTGSAQPMRLEAGKWYNVAPAAHQAPASGQIPTSATSIDTGHSAGKTVWLAASGCIAILAAGLFRVGLPAFKSSSGGHGVVPPFLPRGENKNV